MPVQDNEQDKKAENTADSEPHKSEALLPLFNEIYDSYQDSAKLLEGQKSEIQDKISKSENKISVFSEKADRLETTNEMLKALINEHKLPQATQSLIKANEAKISRIRENQIPKLENSINISKRKIEKLDTRIEISRLKAQKTKALCGVIKSFLVLNPAKRREKFAENMDSLKSVTERLLQIDFNKENAKLENLYQRYNETDSMTKKHDISNKIDKQKSKVADLQNKMNKISKAPEKLSEVKNVDIDKIISQTENSLENAIDNDISENKSVDFETVADRIVVDSATYLYNAEMALEDDFNMIDGIINNGTKTPDKPLFLEEIDFTDCSDEKIQAFRESAKENEECARAISKAISENYGTKSEWTLDTQGALDSVREQFSDERIAFVLANALNGSQDGRIAQDVKKWANDTLSNVPETYTKKKLSFETTHAGLINLFAQKFMQTQEPVKELQAERSENTEPKQALFSIAQYDELRYYKCEDITANELLQISANSEKPFVEMMNLGERFSEIEYAEIQQSDRFKFSVEVNFDDNSAQIYAVNNGKGGIPEGERNSENTLFKTIKLENFVKSEPQKNSPEKPKTSHSKAKTVNPDYYKSLTLENRFIKNEPKKVASIIMNELEKQNIPFSAVEKSKDMVAITVSKENENIFKNIENSAKGTHLKLIHPEVFKVIPKEERFIQQMPESDVKKVADKLEKENIPYSARLDGDKSAITVSKKDAPKATISRKQMKQQATSIKSDKQPKQPQKKKEQAL